MAPPGKVETKTPGLPPGAASAAAPAASVSVAAPAAMVAPQKPACPSDMMERMETRLAEWFEQPGDKKRWRDLMVHTMPDPCGRPALSRKFWDKYQTQTTAKAIELVTQVIKFTDYWENPFVQEVVITAIAQDKKEVRDAIENALLSIPEEQIESGAVSSTFYAKCIHALAVKREEECKTDEKCYARHAKLMDQHRRYNRLVSISLGVAFRSLNSFAGQQLADSAWCGQLAFDVLVDIEKKGIRPMLGGAYTGSFLRKGGLDMIGMRAGLAQRGGVFQLNLFYLEGGIFRVTGKDNKRDDVPVELDNPPVNSTRTAYRMRAHDVDRVLTAGYVTINFEGAQPFTKKSPFHFYWGLSGGVYAGGVTDQPCSYSYKPGAENVQAQPGGSVTATGQLDNRCRSNAFSMGTMWGGTIGVRGVF